MIPAARLYIAEQVGSGMPKRRATFLWDCSLASSNRAQMHPSSSTLFCVAEASLRRFSVVRYTLRGGLGLEREERIWEPKNFLLKAEKAFHLTYLALRKVKGIYARMWALQFSVVAAALPEGERLHSARHLRWTCTLVSCLICGGVQ